MKCVCEGNVGLCRDKKTNLYRNDIRIDLPKETGEFGEVIPEPEDEAVGIPRHKPDRLSFVLRRWIIVATID